MGGGAAEAVGDGALDDAAGAKEDVGVHALLADIVSAVDAVLDTTVVDAGIVVERVSAHALGTGSVAGAGLAEVSAVGLDIADVVGRVQGVARLADGADVGELAKVAVADNI